MSSRPIYSSAVVCLFLALFYTKVMNQLAQQQVLLSSLAIQSRTKGPCKEPLQRTNKQSPCKERTVLAVRTGSAAEPTKLATRCGPHTERSVVDTGPIHPSVRGGRRAKERARFACGTARGMRARAGLACRAPSSGRRRCRFLR